MFGCTEFDMEYDYLIIACGMTNRTFGTPGVDEENRVYFLKSLSDAKNIRSRMIDVFERAANPDLPLEEKKRLLNFMIVGGGPTCIEYAGELEEFISEDVKKIYPDLIDLAKVNLIEVADKIMPSYGKDIQDYVTDDFKNRKINIMTKTSVKEIRRNDKGVTEAELSNGDVHEFGMMVWSTGVEPLQFVKDLECAHDQQGRILIDDKLQVADCPGVYAMGDNAVNANKFLPPVA